MHIEVWIPLLDRAKKNMGLEYGNGEHGLSRPSNEEMLFSLRLRNTQCLSSTRSDTVKKTGI